MSDLSKELQKIIRSMEELRDSRQPPDERIIELLDRLYQQKLDLIKAEINATTDKYQQTFDALKEAGAKTRDAIADLAKLEEALQKIGKAAGKIADLID